MTVKLGTVGDDLTVIWEVSVKSVWFNFAREMPSLFVIG